MENILGIFQVVIFPHPLLEIVGDCFYHTFHSKKSFNCIQNHSDKLFLLSLNSKYFLIHCNLFDAPWVIKKNAPYFSKSLQRVSTVDDNPAKDQRYTSVVQ